MKLASGVMPVVDMLAAGEPVGLATDSAASNNNQDLFQEMNIAAKLQKVFRRDPRALPAWQAVEMATIGGARALHLDRQIGSLEAGKQADLVLIGTGATHSTPMYNVYSQLVYALNAHDVRTVVIAGKIVMEDRYKLHAQQAGDSREGARVSAQSCGVADCASGDLAKVALICKFGV